MHKDKKAMNILFNGLDKDMFDNFINCTTVTLGGVGYCLDPM